MVCLFTLIPNPEVNLDLLSRIEDQMLNVHFLTDSNLGPTCQTFFLFLFFMKISKSSNVCSKTMKLFAEEYCVCDTLRVDNTKLRLCSEWLQYGGLYKWLLNLHICLWNSLLLVSKVQFVNIGFTLRTTKPKEDFLTISPCCQLIMK